MASPLTQLSEQWRALGSLGQRIGILGAIVVLAIIVTVVVRNASAPRFVSLYTNLTQEDAAAVVEKLKESRTPYRLEGSRVDVREDMADEARLALATDGLPRGGSIGFEIFDRSQFGQSEFGEQIQYQRALQGELSRTISKLECVQSATVLLVLPKHRSLYAEEEKPPTASVLLTLRRPPTPANIKAVVHLVSSAVDGLNPSDVRVVDAGGRTLSDMIDATGDGTAGTRMQAQREIEADVERRIQDHLDRVFGPGKALARATARLNFDRRKVDREVYTPGAAAGATSTTGVLESERIAEETYAKNPGTAMGVPGFAPSITPTTTPAIAPGTTAVGSADNAYRRAESNRAYRVSKEVQHIETAPGQVECMKVALLVDATVDASRIAALEEWLTTDANIDPKRGDKVYVTQMPFDTATATGVAQAAAAMATQDRVWTMAKIGGGVLIALIFLIVVFRIYRMTLAPVNAMLVDADAPNGPYPMVLAERAIEQYQSLNAAERHDEAAIEEAQLAQMDPQRVALVIRNMIAEDRA